MSRGAYDDYGDVDARGISPPRRRPASNSWGEVPRASAYDDAPDSARSESQYTDADSVASDAFESGAEDISDDDDARDARRRHSDAADGLADDVGAVRLGSRARRESSGAGAGAGASSSRGGEGDFSEAEVREAFAAFDEDGDGLLDARDVQSFFEALGESLTVHEASELIKMVDGDGDGRVDFDEFFDLATRSAQYVDPHR